MNNKLKNDIIDFIYSFEILFDIDWEYTSEENVIVFLCPEDFKGDLQPYFSDYNNESFLIVNPDEILDWCNYVKFINIYANINETINKIKIMDNSGLTICSGVIIEFIECVQFVFDENWKKTRAILGFDLSGDEEIKDINSKKFIELKDNYLAMFGGEDSEATFLRPLCDDMSQYWPDGAKLLEAYHAVKALDIPWKEH